MGPVQAPHRHQVVLTTRCQHTLGTKNAQMQRKVLVQFCYEVVALCAAASCCLMGHVQAPHCNQVVNTWCT
jgi:hypothetical protein